MQKKNTKLKKTIGKKLYNAVMCVHYKIKHQPLYTEMITKFYKHDI